MLLGMTAPRQALGILVLQVWLYNNTQVANNDRSNKPGRDKWPLTQARFMSRWHEHVIAQLRHRVDCS